MYWMVRPAAAASDADEHALQRGNVAVMRIEKPEESDQRERRPEQPDAGLE